MFSHALDVACDFVSIASNKGTASANTASVVIGTTSSELRRPHPLFPRYRLSLMRPLQPCLRLLRLPRQALCFQSSHSPHALRPLHPCRSAFVTVHRPVRISALSPLLFAWGRGLCWGFPNKPGMIKRATSGVKSAWTSASMVQRTWILTPGTFARAFLGVMTATFYA